MTTERLWSDVAIPPGETLAETLDAMGLTQAELARRAGRPTQAINEIIRGSKMITPETAIQFERVLGISASFWTRLEENYRLNKARIEDRKHLESLVEVAKLYPYAVMAGLGWTPKTRDPVRKVEELLRFFGINSLKDVPALVAQLRRGKREPSKEALAAWIRRAQRLADDIEAQPYDENALRESLPTLRKLTVADPKIFVPELRRILAECGVAFVTLRHLPKTYAHGATSWVRPDKALVQMSIRGSWADIFWFSLFHELGHVISHGRRAVFIEYDNGEQNAQEREADRFASRVLIPDEAYRYFLEKYQPISRVGVIDFARELGISPGIVVGRLQHDKFLPRTHLNSLRARLVWAKEQA